MMLPVVVVFVVCFSIVMAAYWLFVVRYEARTAGLVQRRLKPAGGQAPHGTQLLRQAQAMSAIMPLNALLERWSSRTRSLGELITQANVRTTVGTVLAGSAALGMLVFVVFDRLSLTLIGLAAAGTAACIPIFVLRYLRTRRMRRFEAQLPEALDLLGRALRAGHTLSTGFEMVAGEMDDPIGPEFRIMFDQQTYGMPLADALRGLIQRVPLLDARFFVTAVLIQRESGGNLSEILDNLANVMRERFRVKGQMRVVSAHGRITGWILVCLPPVLAMVMFSSSEEYRTLMLQDPIGQQMLTAAAALQVAGVLVMRKIINVRY